MKSTICLLFIFLIGFSIQAQSIVGEWETFDDKTKEKKALVLIYKEGETYFGKILETYTNNKNEVCDKCKGDKQNQPIIGLEIIQGLEKKENTYQGGTILDPENGEEYKCYLELNTQDKLKVRGYIGVSLFGRTQYWNRKH